MSMLPGWDAPALLEEVLACPRRAFVPMPGLRVVERPGWQQLVTPWLRDGGLNGVSLSVLDSSEADAVIDATIAEYRALGLRFRWCVPPGSAPADLAERLAARGLEPQVVVGMARLTDDALAATPVDVDVVEVGRERVDEFTRVAALGWECAPEPFGWVNRASVEHPDTRVHLYLASLDGVPLATAASHVFDRSVYLLGGVVLPEARGRGLYRALVNARLRDAAARGIGLVTTQALEQTSAPLLAHMGFVPVCRFRVYHG
jgi:GNAT superfamily N-acetyltransferase